tara:strand:- start:151 stop:576 length:426 start_codon:yes stop_codon:yes gene_type:complete
MDLKIIISALVILVSLYGLIKKSRVLFNAGYFVFGIMVVFDQFMLFNEEGAVLHLALASLWLVQCIITLPNKLAYDGSKIAKSAGVKINLVLSIINLFGAFYAQKAAEVPEGATYGHLLLATLPLIVIYFIVGDKIETNNT